MLFVVSLAVIAAACTESQTPVGPSAAVEQTRDLVAAPAAVASGYTLDGPQPGCLTADQAVQWVFTATQVAETVRLYPHAFRDDQAGCQNTTESLATMTITGPVEYLAGASGQTTFSYPPNEVRCGRVTLGVILKDVRGHDTMLSWVVVNSGRDCAAPPPPPPPPPTPPKPCPKSGKGGCR
jgi:hypothetical protein